MFEAFSINYIAGLILPVPRIGTRVADRLGISSGSFLHKFVRIFITNAIYVTIIEDEETLRIGKFVCAYRATRREELTRLLRDHGCREVAWKFPEETGFYQPIVVARK